MTHRRPICSCAHANTVQHINQRYPTGTAVERRRHAGRSGRMDKIRDDHGGQTGQCEHQVEFVWYILSSNPATTHFSTSDFYASALFLLSFHLHPLTSCSRVSFLGPVDAQPPPVLRVNMWSQEMRSSLPWYASQFATVHWIVTFASRGLLEISVYTPPYTLSTTETQFRRELPILLGSGAVKPFRQQAIGVPL